MKKNKINDIKIINNINKQKDIDKINENNKNSININTDKNINIDINKNNNIKKDKIKMMNYNIIVNNKEKEKCINRNNIKSENEEEFYKNNNKNKIEFNKDITKNNKEKEKKFNKDNIINGEEKQFNKENIKNENETIIYKDNNNSNSNNETKYQSNLKKDKILKIKINKKEEDIDNGDNSIINNINNKDKYYSNNILIKESNNNLNKKINNIKKIDKTKIKEIILNKIKDNESRNELNKIKNLSEIKDSYKQIISSREKNIKKNKIDISNKNKGNYSKKIKNNLKLLNIINKNNFQNKYSNILKTEPNHINKKYKEKYYNNTNNYKIKDYKDCFQKEKSSEKNKKILKKEKDIDYLYKFSSLKESVFTKEELKERELNEIILNFIDILYKDVDKFLNNKNALKLYDEKINEIANIIIFMNDVEQVKVMEAMNKAAISYNKKELFYRLSNEVDEMNKIKNYKEYKNVNISKEKEGYTYRESIRKSINMYK